MNVEILHNIVDSTSCIQSKVGIHSYLRYKKLMLYGILLPFYYWYKFCNKIIVSLHKRNQKVIRELLICYQFDIPLSFVGLIILVINKITHKRGCLVLTAGRIDM